ncbi:MAG: hypothetical protein ACXWKG_09170, partial [Limisphaerales bacterium]
MKTKAFKRASCVLIAVLFAGCATHRPDFVHKEFTQRRAEIQRIWVMPPSVGIVLMRYSGKTTLLTNDTQAICARLPQIINSQLFYRGFAVSAVQCTNEVTIKAMQDWMSKKPWRKPVFSVSRKKPIDFAPTARSMSGELDADALLFVQAWGKKNTPGRDFREGLVTTFAGLGGLAGAAGGAGGAEGGFLLVGGTAWVLTGAGKLDEYGFFEHATLQMV